MHREYEEPTIIELDDPVPRGAFIIGLTVSLVVILLIIAPFVITLPGPEPIVSGEGQVERNSNIEQVCRPNINLPSILDDVAGIALPSWMRMCNWFIEPIQETQTVPPD